MFHIKKRYLSFLVGETTLQIAKLSGNGDAFIRFFETAMPPGIVASGEVKNVEALTQFLLAVRKQNKITEAYVSIGIPETKATTHTLDLPHLDVNEIEQAILREAPSFLPFAINEEYIDWKIIDRETESQKVLISAVPKHVVDGFSAAFLKAGFSPVAFETTSLSLFRMVPLPARDLTMAAEIGDTSTVLILVLNRSVDVCSVISDNNNLLDKLHRVIQFFVDRKTEGKMPSMLYLCGKNAVAASAQISNALSIKTQVLKAPLLKYPEQKAAEYAMLYSLANKTVTPPDDKKTINIMPNDLILRYEETQRIQFENVLKVLFLVAIIVFIAVTFFTYQTIDRAQDAIARRAVSSGSTPPAPSRELIFSPARIALLGNLAKQNTAVISMVDTIYQAIPEGINVATISYEKEKNECIVSGLASSRDHIIRYKDALEKTSVFEKVTIPLSSFEKDFDIEYRIVLTLKGKVAVPTPKKATN